MQEDQAVTVVSVSGADTVTARMPDQAEQKSLGIGWAPILVIARGNGTTELYDAANHVAVCVAGDQADAADDEAWGGRGPSASYVEWLAEGQQDQADKPESGMVTGTDVRITYRDDEPEEDPPEPGFDLGPEVDDEGGMSEYRYHEPEPWQ